SETQWGPGKGGQRSPSLAISAIEHPSILEAAKEMRRRGAEVAVLPMSAKGIVAVSLPAVRLVSVMLASNETGVIQPVSEMAALCRQRGILCHTDAVQAVGKIPVHFRELDVDAITVAPHKFHGPLGTGALLVRHGIKLQPQLF